MIVEELGRKRLAAPAAPSMTKSRGKYASCIGWKVVVKKHEQCPMKNTKKNCQQSKMRRFLWKNRAPDCRQVRRRIEESRTPHFFSWCTAWAIAPFLVHKLTNLSQINLFIVDNIACRYDSCSVANDRSSIQPLMSSTDRHD
ncbi:hypothetical protein [Herbaspirillum sp. RV1423]|uniref:hypothetical protein n=1 Tax=Herbaspirillum sp. RV1423 TaxID=1443993 RepID=UPI0012DC960C|nr:hypothetical protein [Herbaspirillum sp. RV1423]